MQQPSLPDIGDVISNLEIHEYFACQTQGGIRGSRTRNNVVIIHDTRKRGPGVLFLDSWDDSGVLHYRGQGRLGDQTLTRMNRRLAESEKNGSAVHLFETSGTNRFTYQGQVELAASVYEVQEADDSGQQRSVLVFPLRRKGTDSTPGKAIPLSINETADEEEDFVEVSDATHTSIQALLIKMGARMGLTVWVARNDRSKEVDGILLQEMPGVRSSLPNQFDPAIMKTIELIDVLWLRGNSIEAAFEIEHSTVIYSGLLRMADLVSMHPNIKIRLFIVAPDVKRDRVLSEIARPIFSSLRPPLHQIARFISYGDLKRLEERLGSDLVGYVDPAILDSISQAATPNAE